MNVNQQKLISAIIFVTIQLVLTHVYVGKDTSLEQIEPVAQVYFIITYW